MISAPTIRAATAADAPTICRLLRALAEYERLTHEVLFDEAQITEHLFGAHPFAEVLLAEEKGQVAGFALFFHNFSTFVGKPGMPVTCRGTDNALYRLGGKMVVRLPRREENAVQLKKECHWLPRCRRSCLRCDGRMENASHTF